MKIKLVFLMLLLLVGCSRPLPEEKLIYAGEWRSKDVQLHILVDGTIDYKRVENGSTTSINGPIKEFKGNNFVVGVGPISTTFEVSEPPVEVDGHWQMVVDGVRLTRVSK